MKIYSYLTLDIKPTDQQYDVFCWFERKIVNNVSYNIRGPYIKEIGRCLEVMIIVKIGQTKIMPMELFRRL
jgi:hypothetical protein